MISSGLLLNLPVSAGHPRAPRFSSIFGRIVTNILQAKQFGWMDFNFPKRPITKSHCGSDASIYGMALEITLPEQHKGGASTCPPPQYARAIDSNSQK